MCRINTVHCVSICLVHFLVYSFHICISSSCILEYLSRYSASKTWTPYIKQLFYCFIFFPPKTVKLWTVLFMYQATQLSNNIHCTKLWRSWSQNQMDSAESSEHSISMVFLNFCYFMCILTMTLTPHPPSHSFVFQLYKLPHIT